MSAVSGCRGRRRAVAAWVVIAGALAAAPAATPVAAPETGPTAGQAALLDTGRDVIVDRAFVPSAERPQGEVRIVRRDGHPVVQTLLYTRVLKRVFGTIGDKERHNWPAGAAGHADMERYVAALEAFRRAAAERPDQAGAEVDRRVRALIEFIDAPGAPLVAIGGVTLEGTGETIRIRTRAAPSVLTLSAAYVRRNMELIVADAFALTSGEAAARLARAGGP